MSASSSTSWWRFLFGGGESSLRESIEDVLEETQGETADFSDEERHMLKNLLGFRDVRLDDVMVPRADIDAVEADIQLRDLLALFADCGHSRMPVYRETLDQPIGMVHVKDVLSAVQSSLGQDSAKVESIELTPLVRPVLFVPPSMPAMELLVKMQATRGHMALVIDEYGGTDGLVTIEDLIEEIVGEIEDEHDEEEELLKPLTEDGHWRAQARLPLSELESALDVSLSSVEGYDDMDTLGGLVFAKAGRVPERGEMIAHDMGDGRALEFIIHDGDARRIKQLDIRLVSRSTKSHRAPSGQKGKAG